MTKKEEIRGYVIEFDKRESITQWLGVYLGDEKSRGVIGYLHSQGVVIKGQSLGGSHPHLADYYTMEPLIGEG